MFFRAMWLVFKSLTTKAYQYPPPSVGARLRLGKAKMRQDVGYENSKNRTEKPSPDEKRRLAGLALARVRTSIKSGFPLFLFSY